MVYPFLSGGAVDDEPRACFQGSTAALHGARDGASLHIGYLQGVSGNDAGRTFYIEGSPAVVACLAQDGFLATAAAQHDTTGADA